MAKPHPFDPELVRELAGLLADTDLTEIEVEKGDLRIRVARTVTVAPPAPVPTLAVAPVPAASEAPRGPGPAKPGAAADVAAPGPNTLTSPMVGTAYLRPNPTAKPFVEIGQDVKAGEKLLLIEAMKTFNDIVAHRSGTVRAIFVEDGQPVEYGEPLVDID
ncbi:MAG: acetyl-CoA carboxylase biotin carboxyl carrier protein [Methylobacteriaceae bacterium]|nr:acetyl-CoA carboxylase biotin carboxyl carrier protein [Methylobacteriaceae bacterium]